MYDMRLEDGVTRQERFAATFPTEWKKGDCLGGGSYGKVYHVVNKNNLEQEVYVVKEVEIPLNQKEEYEGSFRREIEVFLLLNEHQRIVPFCGYLLSETIPSIFMIYMPQGSLSSFTRSRPLPEDECFNFTGQILEGLAYLHEKGIIHRDIKGTNILLDNDRSIRLTDFGISKIVDDNSAHHTREQGSWRWMAPEVCTEEFSNGHYSYKADVWSLGCTVIEMLTGDRPYSSLLNTIAVILKVGHGIHPEFPNNISERMQDFLNKTFNRSPTERKSSSELIHQFFPNLNTYHESEGILLGSAKSETNISLPCIKCSKHHNHPSYIPIQAFSEQDIPAAYRGSNVYRLIQSVAELTIKIDVFLSSYDRPKFWPHSLNIYPYTSMEDRTLVRSGSGLVYNIILHTDGRSKCPCQRCILSNEPSKAWGTVEIMTAAHVVYNQEEAMTTTCRLFYDSSESDEIVFDSFRLVSVDTRKDWCLLRCTSCNIDIIERLNKGMMQFEKIRTTQLLQNPEGGKLGFIVSHPHGGPKMISIGKLMDTMCTHETWSQFVYTMSTCLGSSGAYVHIVGNSGNVWHFPHVHHGTYGSEINCSTVGYYASDEKVDEKNNVNIKVTHIGTDVPSFDSDKQHFKLKDDKRSNNIPKNWRKGELIDDGKYSAVYTLVDPAKPHDRLYMIKERWLIENQNTYDQILDGYDKEFSILQGLVNHERIVSCFGYTTDTCNWKISKFLSYMSMGSISQYYKKNGPIDEGRCLFYTKQILEGLEYLHSEKIIHMNIRGKNIFLESETHIRISGFEHYASGTQLMAVANPHSIRWTAPELINPKFGFGMFNKRADVWSLGCTIVEMLTGDVPYEYIKTLTAVVMEIGNGKAPFLRLNISQEMKHMIDTFFTPDANCRNSVTQLLKEISKPDAAKHNYSEQSINVRTPVSFKGDGETKESYLIKSDVIPITKFNLSHLPESYHDEDLYMLIKALADLTVQINVKVTSLQELSLTSYQFGRKRVRTSTMEGDGRRRVSTTRTGSGVILGVMKFIGGRSKTCRCYVCKNPFDNNQEWWTVFVETASELVLGDEESRHISCRLFYNEPNSPEVVLDKVDLDYAIIKEGRCLLRCVTRDIHLVQLLDQMVIHYHSCWSHVHDKYQNINGRGGLSVIVSSPSGHHKHVKVDYYSHPFGKAQDWKQYVNTTFPFPGSIGARVYCPGYSGLTWGDRCVHRS